MSMYECVNCGIDPCDFPRVFLAIQKKDGFFEKKHGKLVRKLAKKLQLDLSVIDRHPEFWLKVWEKFWEWLGRTQILWFCSMDCAKEYLEKKISDERFYGEE